MFGVGIPELMLLGVVALLAFGPDKLPDFARQAGRLVRQVHDLSQATREQLRHEFGPELADLDLDLDGVSATIWDSTTLTSSEKAGRLTPARDDQRRPEKPTVADSPHRKSGKHNEPTPEGSCLYSEQRRGRSVVDQPKQGAEEVGDSADYHKPLTPDTREPDMHASLNTDRADTVSLG